MSEREQEIIAVGASIASGCLPCTKSRLRAAASAGAKAREVLDAVRDATQVRRAATEIMARAGGRASAEERERRPQATEAPALIRALVSVSAAYALGVSDDRAATCCDGEASRSAGDASACAPGADEGADGDASVCQAGDHRR